ncbi:hypothetical protein NMG60_11032859 [Bertholletia excelsa]
MGSCISRCSRKRKRQEEPSLVEDKLVITHAPTPPIPPPLPPGKQAFSPSHSPLSTSSVSSISCTTSNVSSSCSSLTSSSSSCSSSSMNLKGKSFSNEFLWSCVKENPHLIHIDPFRGSLQHPIGPTMFHAQKLGSPMNPNVAPAKQSIGSPISLRHSGAAPQKRARVNSANLARQKSFRLEPERPSLRHSLPSSTLKSPSPSRRFSGENLTRKEMEKPSSPVYSLPGRSLRSPSPSRRFSQKENTCKRSAVKRESLWPASPSNNLSRFGPCLMNREKHLYRVGSKIDESAVGEVLSSQNTNGDALPMEDIDNPLIALDCFIFL